MGICAVKGACGGAVGGTRWGGGLGGRVRAASGGDGGDGIVAVGARGGGGGGGGVEDFVWLEVECGGGGAGGAETEDVVALVDNGAGGGRGGAVGAGIAFVCSLDWRLVSGQRVIGIVGWRSWCREKTVWWLHVCWRLVNGFCGSTGLATSRFGFGWVTFPCFFLVFESSTLRVAPTFAKWHVSLKQVQCSHSDFLF